MAVLARRIGGLAGLTLYVGACLVVAREAHGATAVAWALIAIAGLAGSAYLWRTWWFVMAAAVAASGVVALLTQTPHPLFIAAAAGFAAMVGWWATLSFPWTLKAWQAFYAIGLLVMVSLTLSAVIGLAPVPLRSRSVADLVVLYLSTPPWEWAVVVTALCQARSLGRFVRSRYRWEGGQALRGLFVGIGLVAMTAVLVDLESRGFHIRVVANNPFVTTPGLKSHDWGAAAAIAFAVVVLAPLAEEALFRGILFGSLANRWGYLWGSGVSALVFGLAHLNLTLLVPLALAGVALNALYRSSDSLVPSTVAHMTLNAVSVLSALGFVR